MVDIEDPTNDELITLNRDDIEGIELVDEGQSEGTSDEGE